MALGDWQSPIVSAHWQALVEAIRQQLHHRSSPLSIHWLLTPSPSWAKAIIHGNEGGFGFLGGVETDYPARFLWRVTQLLYPQVSSHSPFEPVAMAWQLFRLFQSPPSLLQTTALMPWLITQPPQAQWQLAQQLAGIFHRYRLDAYTSLACWEDLPTPLEGEHAWQIACWQSLRSAINASSTPLSTNSREISTPSNPLVYWVNILEQGASHPQYALTVETLKSLPWGDIHVWWSEPLQPLLNRAFLALSQVVSITAWRWLPLASLETVKTVCPALVPLLTERTWESPLLFEQTAVLPLAGQRPDKVVMACAPTILEECTAAVRQLIDWIHDFIAEDSRRAPPTVAVVCTNEERYRPLLAGVIDQFGEGLLALTWHPAVSPDSQRFFECVLDFVTGGEHGTACAEHLHKIVLDDTVMTDHGWHRGFAPMLTNWLRDSGWRIGDASDQQQFPDVASHGYESARGRLIVGWFADSALLPEYTDDTNEARNALGAVVDTSVQQGEMLAGFLNIGEACQRFSRWATVTHPLAEWRQQWKNLLAVLSPTHLQAWQSLDNALAQQPASETPIDVGIWVSLYNEALATLPTPTRASEPNDQGNHPNWRDRAGKIPVTIFPAKTDTVIPTDVILVLGMSTAFYPAEQARLPFDLLGEKINFTYLGQVQYLVMGENHDRAKRQLAGWQWLACAQKRLWISYAKQGLRVDDQAPATLFSQWQEFLPWLEVALSYREINANAPLRSAIAPTTQRTTLSDNGYEAWWQVRRPITNSPLWMDWEQLIRESTQPQKAFFQQFPSANPRRLSSLSAQPLTRGEAIQWMNGETGQHDLIAHWWQQRQAQNNQAVDMAFADCLKKWRAEGHWLAENHGSGRVNLGKHPGQEGLPRWQEESLAWLRLMDWALNQQNFTTLGVQTNASLPAWQWSALVREARDIATLGTFWSHVAWRWQSTAGTEGALWIRNSPPTRSSKNNVYSPEDQWRQYCWWVFQQASAVQPQDRAYAQCSFGGIWCLEMNPPALLYYPPIPIDQARDLARQLIQWWHECLCQITPAHPQLSARYYDLLASHGDQVDFPEKAHLALQKEWMKIYTPWQGDPFADNTLQTLWQSGLFADASSRIDDAIYIGAELWQGVILMTQNAIRVDAPSFFSIETADESSDEGAESDE